MVKKYDELTDSQGERGGTRRDVLAEGVAGAKTDKAARDTHRGHSAAERQPGSQTDEVETDDPSTCAGQFFIVDARVWPIVCLLGMNAAVAYLVLARGSDRRNGHTTWSVHAIEKYTSMSRVRARVAIESLIWNAAVARVDPNTSRPRYRLLPASECLRIRMQRGLATTPAAELRAASLPHCIWLPNTLVSGAANETPPVELIRQGQDVMALRLLVDLYGDHHLRADGGIRRDTLWEEYKRVKLGETGPFVVWGFMRNQKLAACEGAVHCHWRSEPDVDHPAVDFWHRWGQLETLGLIDFVPHLVEGRGPDTEIIHPYGMGQTNSLEDRLGIAASEAGYALMTEISTNWANQHHLAPVPRHITNVQMIGIARLLYRPHTRTTAAWWRHLQEEGEKHLLVYDRIVASREPKICNLNG